LGHRRADFDGSKKGVEVYKRLKVEKDKVEKDKQEKEKREKVLLKYRYLNFFPFLLFHFLLSILKRIEKFRMSAR
jgi:hypothetical protein